MKKFFKYFFASLLATLIAGILGIFIFVGIIANMIPKSETVTVNPKTTLIFEFSGEIVDRAIENPFGSIDIPQEYLSNQYKAKGLNNILQNLEKAKDDPNVSGILLRPDYLTAGLATIEEIRTAIEDFKTSGKYVISYADFYSLKAYYLATAADEIYVNPVGIVDFRGLGGNMMFFRRTLDKLGVEPQIIRYGKFKSAGEMFMLDKISPENYEQTFTYINSLWNNMLSGINKTRNIEVAELQKFADNYQIRFPQDAINAKMIDGVKFYDEIISQLKEKTETEQDKDLATLDFFRYTRAPKPKTDKLLTEQPKIAVIYAQGEIGMGKGKNDEIGLENISKAFVEARKDEKVKAVVLRVNSPGGSALTSDIILREAELTKQVKPVIVSMGNVAASGGYYISCASDVIVANPNTLTGSIGVFGLLFNAEKLLNNLGISYSTIKTGKYADFASQNRKLSTDERFIMQQYIDHIYITFVNHVCKARNKTFEEVDNIGQGRVWSGIDAKKVGLVDEFGGLNDAIKIAAQKAEIEDYRIVELPKVKDPFTAIFDGFGEMTKLKKISENIKVSQYIEHIFRALEMEGAQMRMEYDVELY